VCRYWAINFSLRELNMWYISRSHVSFGLAFMWRNKRLVSYSLLFWTSISRKYTCIHARGCCWRAYIYALILSVCIKQHTISPITPQ
jgi:hypothetical protein